MALVTYVVLTGDGESSYTPVAQVTAANPDDAIDEAIAALGYDAPAPGAPQRWAAVPVRFWSAKTVGIEQPPPVITKTDAPPDDLPVFGAQRVAESSTAPEADPAGDPS